MVVLAAVVVLTGCGGGRSEAENGLIAYVMSSGVAYRAYVIQPDGTGRRQLTTGVLNEECPRWSPDGKRLALAAYRTSGGLVTGSWLQVVSADGELEWSTLAAPTRCPQWSPDGSRIAFVSGSALAVVDAEGGAPRRLADDVAARRDLAWSPDGGELAYVPTGHDDGRSGALAITVVDADTAEKRLFTVTGGGVCREGEGVADPRYRFSGGQALAWSPGGEILFSLEEPSCGSIFSVAADGTSEHRVTPPGIGAEEPAWSPDGSRIAFSAAGGRGAAARQDAEIWVREPDGTGFVNVTDNVDSDSTPVWAPDGLQLAFLRTGSSNTDALYVADSTGGAPLRLEDDVSETGASWQPLS
jgi:dipeptidyl aminopeptidase/acylaminoacyl peptidase